MLKSLNCFSLASANIILSKQVSPRSNIPWWKKMIWVIGVLRRTAVGDWRFDNLCGSHLQRQVIVLVIWKFKNSGEQFHWSMDRVAIDKSIMWLAVKKCPAIGYANRNSQSHHTFTNQVAHQDFWVFKWLKLSLDFEDGFQTSGQNASCQQQSFSGPQHPDDLFQSR